MAEIHRQSPTNQGTDLERATLKATAAANAVASVRARLHAMDAGQLRKFDEVLSNVTDQINAALLSPSPGAGFDSAEDSRARGIRLSRALIEVLDRQGYTRFQTGIVLNIHPSEVSRIAAGKRELKADDWLLVAKELQLPVAAVTAVAQRIADCWEGRPPVSAASSRSEQLVSAIADETERILATERARGEDKTKARR